MQSKLYVLLAVVLMVGLWSCSDDNEVIVEEGTCGTKLYVDGTFDTDTVTVKFGENFKVNGELQELYMDIYTPEGTMDEKRPVMIWAFGGAFVQGTRGTMSGFANLMAQKGYVAASIDYRILDLSDGVADLDSTKGVDIALKAMGDMKAAIRFFKQDAATANLYNIDPDKIYVGGVSAGAITALNAAVVQSTDPIDATILAAIEANGGFEGNSGDAENMMYDSKVAGVVNISGAVLDLNWIDANDPPVFSLHGTADGTVKYGAGNVELIPGRPILKLNGSGVMHPWMEQLGIKNQLITVEGGGHSDLFGNSFTTEKEQFFADMPVFVKELICQ